MREWRGAEEKVGGRREEEEGEANFSSAPLHSLAPSSFSSLLSPLVLPPSLFFSPPPSPFHEFKGLSTAKSRVAWTALLPMGLVYCS